MQTSESTLRNGISSRQQRHHNVAVSSRARCCHALHRCRQPGVCRWHVRQPARHWHAVLFGQIPQPKERRQHLHHKSLDVGPDCYCYN